MLPLKQNYPSPCASLSKEGRMLRGISHEILSGIKLIRFNKILKYIFNRFQAIRLQSDPSNTFPTFFPKRDRLWYNLFYQRIITPQNSDISQERAFLRIPSPEKSTALNNYGIIHRQCRIPGLPFLAAPLHEVFGRGETTRPVALGDDVIEWRPCWHNGPAAMPPVYRCPDIWELPQGPSTKLKSENSYLWHREISLTDDYFTSKH